MLELLAAFVKFALYAGCLASAGAAFAAASLRSLPMVSAGQSAPTIRIAALAVMLAASASMLLLILRLGGDFSEPVLRAVLESPPAPAAGLQIAGAAILLVFAGRGDRTAAWIRLAGAVFIVSSFAVNGHAPSLDLISGTTAGLHVAAAAWWVGGLLLLGPACLQLRGEDLALLVHGFSRQAMAVATLLVVAGLLIILALVEFGDASWFTTYVQMLLLKVVLAAAAMSLAIYNKFALTPRLADDKSAGRLLLRQSIGFELVVIAGVLAATALLTTYTSPHA